MESKIKQNGQGIKSILTELHPYCTGFIRGSDDNIIIARDITLPACAIEMVLLVHMLNGGK